MAEDLLKSLQTYKVQLEQVEAALTSDPTNEELTKLQNDLTEVISLTKNLLEAQTEASLAAVKDKELSQPQEIQTTKQWKVGDQCSAVWSEDGKWYNCTIDAITEDGMVAITFEEYGNSDVTKIHLLRDKRVESTTSSGALSAESDKTRKRKLEHQRLVAKKKKQKKFDRQKMIEEAHEADKAKWQAFNSKVSKSKKLKGITKKSIFATPEAANGRVGIGTCGIGGRPMTEYTHAEKWRKGT